MSKSEIDEVAESFDAERNFRMSRREDVIGGLFALFALAAALAIIHCCAGCTYKGATVTEGTDLSIGLTMPGSDGVLQLDALNYLTGFRLGVAENAQLDVAYSCSETNEYLWGAVRTSGGKRVAATVRPCEIATDSRDREGETESDEPPGDR